MLIHAYASGGEQISLGPDPGALDRIARDGGGKVGQFVLVAEFGIVLGGIKIAFLQFLLLGQDGYHDELALVHQLLLVLLVDIHLDAAFAVHAFVVVATIAISALIAIFLHGPDDTDGVGNVRCALRPIDGGAPERGDLFLAHVSKAWDAPLLDGRGEGHTFGGGDRKSCCTIGLLIICVMSCSRRHVVLVIVDVLTGTGIIIIRYGFGKGRTSSPVDSPLRSY